MMEDLISGTEQLPISEILPLVNFGEEVSAFIVNKVLYDTGEEFLNAVREKCMVEEFGEDWADFMRLGDHARCKYFISQSDGAYTCITNEPGEDRIPVWFIQVEERLQQS
jgi:hypothetical protein